MDELDKLKKDWNKTENNYPTFSEKEIYGMLHKKSSSIVKWILIISILEFAFWSLCALISSFVSTDFKTPLFIEVLDYINYFVLIAFITAFYINYKKISVEKPVESLLKNIIDIRRVVKFYVIYNLCVISFSLICALWLYKDGYGSPQNSGTVITIGIVFIILIFLLIYFIYKLLYGRLLNKLNLNYIELQKIKQL